MPPPLRTRLPKGFVGYRPDLGEFIRNERRARLWKQSAFAEEIGIRRGSLSRIERGHALPMPDTIDAIIRAFDLDWADVALKGQALTSRKDYDGTFRHAELLDIGSAIRRGRRRLGLKLHQVTTQTILSAAQLSRLERGALGNSRVVAEFAEDHLADRRDRRLFLTDPYLSKLERAGRKAAEPRSATLNREGIG
jgi:transcriptional regulator with XRE-family HTH domain